MEFTQYILLAAVLAGATEMITRLRAKDYWVVATIATSAIIGGLFGYFNIEGLPNVVTGIAAGFGVSGVLKAIGTVGNKSAPAPSTLTEKSKS